MDNKQRAVVVKLAFVLVLPLFFSGCIAPSENESRGVKFSDAMNVSATGDRQDLGGRHTREHDSDDNDSTEPSAIVSDVVASGMDTVSYDNKEYHWQTLADVSYSLPINSDFTGITHFTLDAGCH